MTDIKDMRLYDIAPELRDAIMSEDEGMEERLTELAVAFETKAVSIRHIAGEIDGFIAMAKEEEKRINQQRKYAENRLARLKAYLHGCMADADVSKIEVGTTKITLQNNPPKLVIEDEELVPQKYKTVEQVISIDKNAIKADLKAGKVAGCHLEQGVSLRFK